MYGTEIIYFVISIVVIVAVAALLMKFAFGGKKDSKVKSEKLFETTAFLGSKAPWGMIVDKDRHEDPSKKKE